MPDDRTLVINTGPVLALIAALGDLALLTGSLGILIKGIRVGKKIDLNLCIEKMRSQGIWVGERTARKALEIVSHP